MVGPVACCWLNDMLCLEPQALQLSTLSVLPGLPLLDGSADSEFGQIGLMIPDNRVQGVLV